MEQSNRPPQRFSTEEKRRHVSAWSRSGLKRSEYARRHQLASSSFSKWCARYGKPAPLKSAAPLKPILVQQPPALPVGSMGAIKLHLRDKGCLELPGTILMDELIKLTRALLWS